MNRCRTRRWMALFAGMVMAATMLFSAIPVYADEQSSADMAAGAPAIIDLKPERIKDNGYLFDVTVYLMGTKEQIENVAGSVIRLTDCTLQQRKKDGKAPDIFDYVARIEEAENYPKDSLSDEFKYIPVVFENLYTRYKENTISFTIHSAAGVFTLSKNFTISEKGLIPPPSSSTPDEDDEEETPIAALKPHLIVDSYSYGEAVAGQDVPVTFTLKNTSANKAIRNVVLNVKPAGDLRIKSASDTIFVDTILPGKTVTKTMNFFLGANTSVKVQEIGIASTFEYFDIEGQNAVSGGDNVTISIPTDTIERVRIQKVELPQMIYPGSEEEIAYSVVNAGFATLYNCEIRVVDEADTEYAYAYIGSLDPSKAVSETYLPIVLDTPGETNLKFVFTYENDRLQAGEVTRDFIATVMEIPEYIEPPITEPFPPEEFPAEGQGMPLWLLLTIIGGGIVVAIVAAVIIVKVVKKKRSELDDEDI